jgi:hypothetical protein
LSCAEDSTKKIARNYKKGIAPRADCVYKKYISKGDTQMTKAQIAKLIEAANEFEAVMLKQMTAAEYKSYMAMPRDDRFKLVCAGLAAVAA